jgi:1-deoxy-D-xylulose-5-phosphate reductoisomerase
MAAIVGAAGLARPGRRRDRRDPAWPTGSLVCGPALIERVKRSGGRLLPVDSEHSAIHQVFPHDAPERVAKLVLTASGGPFRRTPLEALKSITPEQAVAHPNWSMGAKISVDSANPTRGWRRSEATCRRRSALSCIRSRSSTARRIHRRLDPGRWGRRT